MPLSPAQSDPFLRAIRANKDDDLPRLVFADVLEETGDPDDVARAEFIRLGIEKCLPQTDATRSAAIDRRIQELFTAVGRDRVLALFSGTTPADWTYSREGGPGASVRFEVVALRPDWFRRGFVRDIAMSHDCFLKNAAAIFRANPVGCVTLTDITAADRSVSDWTTRRNYIRGGPIYVTEEEVFSLPRPPRDYTDQAVMELLSAACVRYGELLVDPPIVDLLPAPGTLLAFDPLTRRYSPSATPTAILV